MEGAEWVKIPCPSCGEEFATVDGRAVRFMRFTGVHCECGFTESFEWVNPRFEVPVEQVRKKLEHQKTLVRNEGTRSHIPVHYIYWQPS